MTTNGRSPRLSVVMPTHNRAHHLEAAVGRVLAQSFDDFELIIVDDGSTDTTPEVLASVNDERVRVVRRENGGISAARNTGVDVALGDFVVPLDDDDVPHPDWLAGLDELLRTSGAAVVSCGCVIVDDISGSVIDHRRPRLLGPAYANIAGLFLAGTFAVERDLYLEVGGFTEGLQCSHQTEFALRVAPHCRSTGRTIATSDRHLIDIRRRPPGERPEIAPAKLLQGSTFLIDTHGTALARDPAFLANTHAIAGVNAFKLGDATTGRRHLRRAARTAPLSWRHTARLAVACVPSVARRVWIAS